MASFCHFWTMTPADYWELRPDEARAMTSYAKRYVDEQKRAQDGR